MNLLMLAILLLLIMVWSIYAMTRTQAIEKEIQQLVEKKPVVQIYEEYLSNRFTLNLFVAGGILLTGAFAIIFFGAGGLDPTLWTITHWLFALIGLTATIAVTLGQRSLYASIRQNIAAYLVTVLILVFVIFSEVATSSEREDSLVRERSLQSPTLAALLTKLQSPDAIPHSNIEYLQAEAARYQSLADQCRGACKRANQARSEAYQARVQAASQRLQQTFHYQAQNKQALINASQALEYQEQNHTAIIRWLKEISASSYHAAMMFASLVFVVAFEAGFHFTGTRHGIYIEALSRLGYSVRLQREPPPLLKRDSHLTQTNEDPITTLEQNKSQQHSVHKQQEVLYEQWKQAIQSNELNPTVLPTKQWLKDHNLGEGHRDRQELANQWLTRLQQEGVLTLNPQGGKGRSKYILTEGV